MSYPHTKTKLDLNQKKKLIEISLSSFIFEDFFFFLMTIFSALLIPEKKSFSFQKKIKHFFDNDDDDNNPNFFFAFFPKHRNTEIFFNDNNLHFWPCARHCEKKANRTAVVFCLF